MFDGVSRDCEINVWDRADGMCLPMRSQHHRDRPQVDRRCFGALDGENREWS
jgi:hypothetical protein